jgi:hypothetical protein
MLFNFDNSLNLPNGLVTTYFLLLKMNYTYKRVLAKVVMNLSTGLVA